MGRPPKPVKDTTWFVAPTEMPQTPDDLTGEARHEWSRLGPYLEAVNRVSKIDALPLLEYCLAWGRFDHIMANHFHSHGHDLDAEGPSSRVAHPLLAPLVDSANVIFTYGEQWGLTARSRALDGNKHVPAEIKKLFGNRRKVAESKIPSSILPMMPEWCDDDIKPPVWANDRVREMYTSVGAELRNLDLLTPLDRVQLIVMVTLHDLLLRAHEQLTDDLVAVMSKQGEHRYDRANPLYEVINKITVTTRRFYMAYGMTAKARRLLPSEEKVESSRPLVFRGKFG